MKIKINCIFDMKGGAISHCNSLLSRSLYSKYRRPRTGAVETKRRRGMRCVGSFFSFFRPTRIEPRMFWSTDASVSCNNISAVATCEHMDLASSPNRLQSISGGGMPGEPGRCSPDTPGPTVPKDPGAGATLPRAALPGTLMPAPHLTKSCSKPPASSLS
jgi:hypothetical protein